MRSRHLQMAVVIAFILAALPLSAALAPPIPNMISPTNPVLADTIGSGVPNRSGDTAIGLSRINNTVTINSPWTCNGTSNKNKVTLSNPDGSGRFQTVTRFSENLNKSQSFTITGFDSNGDPTQFRYSELAGVTETRSGIGTLLSSQHNFVYDTLELQQNGGGLNTSVSFLYFSSNGGALADFMSIPWGQVSALGGKSTDCAGGNPQVFVPITPNGKIVFDLDGNSQPDPDLFQSPDLAPIAIASVPALGPMGLAALAALLLGFALYWLRRESTPTAPTGA